MKSTLFVLSFLIAFLLFAVQPMASKMVLPTLGGTPAVWNTVMFTFQLLLLAGYIYAHLLTRYVPLRWQVLLHAAVVGAAFAFLPLQVVLETSDALVESPIRHLVGAFLWQIGLPFFCLSATAPLLQFWLSRSRHALAQTPYVLYSASNLGSFAGLIGYIILVEPLLDLSQQRIYWSVLFVVATGALIAGAWRLVALRTADAAPVEAMRRPPFKMAVAWVWLAFLVSSLSLGVTTYIATDVASIPLLWVVPLSIYLLSFVDAFRVRPAFVGIAQRVAPILGVAALLVYGLGGHGMAGTYLFHMAAFTSIAFALHGWLATRRPDAQFLTYYYVLLSVGGLLGGVMNGLVAPMVLHEALEYPMVLFLAAITSFVLLRQAESAKSILRLHLNQLATTTLVLVGLLLPLYGLIALNDAVSLWPLNSYVLVKAAMVAAILSVAFYRNYARGFYAVSIVGLVGMLAVSNGTVGYETLFRDRNFFGVSRVYEHAPTNARYYMHGTTLHGLQSLDPKEALQPKAYYAVIKDIFSALPNVHQRPLAIVGLGVGTLKCIAHDGQEVDAYEIDPLVRDIALNSDYFTYLERCKGTHRIIMGDGRIRIGQQPDGRYGVILLDAFSSDAIPVHLLTQEAMATYVSKLAPRGVLLLNTTNRHVDLWPLLGTQAKALGLVAYGKSFTADAAQPLMRSSYWVVVARDAKDVAAVTSHQKGWQRLEAGAHQPWTDNYTNLLPYFKVLQ